MNKQIIDLSNHLEKWGCDNVITKAAVLELLKILKVHVENGKIVMQLENSNTTKQA